MSTTTRVCRCCGEDLAPGRRYTAILVSRVQPSATTSVTGKYAATSCTACADVVAAGVLHRAQLWTPEVGCACRTPSFL